MREELPDDESELTTLTVQQAKALVERDNEGYLNLDGLTTVSCEVAEVLAELKGEL